MLVFHKIQLKGACPFITSLLLWVSIINYYVN